MGCHPSNIGLRPQVGQYAVLLMQAAACRPSGDQDTGTTPSRWPARNHVRTRVRTPGQNGSRERGFGTLKYERLFIDEIDDAVMLAKHAEEYRLEYNQIRPHEAIAWNRPQQVHTGMADPKIPTFQTKEHLPTP